MTDFSDRPFVAGSLIGLRAFAVDRYGRLSGPSTRELFVPGENVASCLVESRKGFAVTAPRTTAAHLRALSSSLMSSSFILSAPTWEAHTYQSCEEVEPEPEEPPPHTVATIGCTCGFYAYFDGSNEYAGPGTITAVVEGYGVSTVGDRGFRASKGRVLAFVSPTDHLRELDAEQTPASWWQRHGAKVLWPLIGGNVAQAAVHAVAGSWWWSGVSALAALFAVAALVLLVVAGRRRRERQETQAKTRRPLAEVDQEVFNRFPLVTRNYPDVPVFESLDEALAAFPLTTQPDPTPEDDDFWTRPVAS